MGDEAGGWGQMMEGESIGFPAVMGIEVMSSPPSEDSSMLEIPSLCEGWLMWPLSFHLRFLLL